MRGVAVLFRLCWIICVALGLCLSVSASVGAPPDETGKLLPDKIGTFRALRPTSVTSETIGRAEKFKVTSVARRDYLSVTGEKIAVILYRTASDSCAYGLLLDEFHNESVFNRESIDGLGIAATSLLPDAKSRILGFSQGPFYVRLTEGRKRDTLLDLARQLAATLDKGEGEIPSLVKHLPDWEQAQKGALYAVTPAALNEFTNRQPVLSAVSFEGGTEAVVANYYQGLLVIVEFSTPQLATANDAAMQAKIKELQAAGQPAPSAYKRVGNYGVFVFNAPDEQTAQQLINQVKYEQTVQWLGENPYPLINAQKRYVAIASGIFLSVIKASGLAILLVLAVGGVIGALVFRRRRAQQTEALYTDAGGMMRLNLDDLTPEPDPARLLKEGKP
jgi:hypothetical protein